MIIPFHDRFANFKFSFAKLFSFLLFLRLFKHTNTHKNKILTEQDWLLCNSPDTSFWKCMCMSSAQVHLHFPFSLLFNFITFIHQRAQLEFVDGILIVDLIKDWWDSKLPESGVISWLSVIPKVLLAGAITLMDELYYKLAVWLNDQGLSHLKFSVSRKKVSKAFR